MREALGSCARQKGLEKSCFSIARTSPGANETSRKTWRTLRHVCARSNNARQPWPRRLQYLLYGDVTVTYRHSMLSFLLSTRVRTSSSGLLMHVFKTNGSKRIYYLRCRRVAVTSQGVGQLVDRQRRTERQVSSVCTPNPIVGFVSFRPFPVVRTFSQCSSGRRSVS